MDEAKGWLDAETFQTVVTSTPLISIDLLVENEQGEYLLGLRKNRPAQGYWFVPGGRVLKNESLDEAFKRITREELGIELKRNQAQFVGIYEHFYDDTVFGENSDTHYIVLAYHLKANQGQIALNQKQHSSSNWYEMQSLNKLAEVHRNTREYFSIKD